MGTPQRSCALLMFGLLLGLIGTGLAPLDRGTWFMEVAPVLVVMPLLWLTRRHFPLTDLAYSLIFIIALIMMIGGYYTYARVPLGFWVRDALHLVRNDYDRLGHLAQGMVPAIVVRELLLRCTPLQRGAWLFALVTATCLAISACYEFVEWWAALLLGAGADAFLGTQGDVWDTQWDMFTAFLGAMLAQLVFAAWHDRQLARLTTVRQE